MTPPKSILVLLSFLIFCSSVSANAMVGFRDYDLEKAKGVAKFEQKNIVVYYSAEWCTPCRLLEQGALNDHRVINLMNGEFVNIKADFEDTNDDQWFETYDIEVLPAILIISKDGTVRKRLEGLLTIDILYKTLQQYIKGGRPIDPIDYQARYLEKNQVLKNSMAEAPLDKKTVSNSVIISYHRHSKEKKARKALAGLTKKYGVSAKIFKQQKDNKIEYVIRSKETFDMEAALTEIKRLNEEGYSCFIEKPKH